MFVTVLDSDLGILNQRSFLQWKSCIFYSTFPLRRPYYYVDSWGYIARSLGRNKILYYPPMVRNVEGRCRLQYLRFLNNSRFRCATAQNFGGTDFD